MKAMVTGARGFIGSFLVESLLSKGVEVHCLLRDKKGGDGWLSGRNFVRVPGDVTDPDSLAGAMRGFDRIYHLAGCTKAIDQAEFQRTNVDGTQNLLEAVCKQNADLKRFVLISSLAAAGPSYDGQPLKESDPPKPVSNYGRSKLAAEQVALSFADNIPLTIVRPPSVYGPRDTDVFTYFKYATQGIRPVLSGGERTASFAYVKDLAEGIILAAEKEASVGKTYYICDDTYYTWDELGTAIAEVLGVKTRRIVLPLFLAFVVAAAADLTARLVRRPSILNLDKYRELKMPHWICSNEKAKIELDFSPKFELRRGLQETAEWYLKNGWIKIS